MHGTAIESAAIATAGLPSARVAVLGDVARAALLGDHQVALVRIDDLLDPGPWGTTERKVTLSRRPR